MAASKYVSHGGWGGNRSKHSTRRHFLQYQTISLDFPVVLSEYFIV